MNEFQNNKYVIDSLLHRVVDSRFHQYYSYYGTEGCRARNYQDSDLRAGWEDSTKENKLSKLIYSRFKEGDRLVMSDAKQILKELYQALSLNRSPKGTDLRDYFELSKTHVTVNGEVKNGFKLGRRLK